MDFFRRLFDSEFMPHGHCYEWRPDILWLHVISDSMVTLAYAIIPIILFWFVKKRQDIAFRGIFLLFSAFILLCGATHALEIWAVWHGTYRLTGVVKAMTGIVSMGTAGALVYLFPKALRLPTPKDLERANRKLYEETQERLKAEADLANAEREALFRVMIAAAPNGLLLVDREGLISLANDAASRVFGYSVGDFDGMALNRLISDGLHGQHDQWLQAFFENPHRRSMAMGRELFGLNVDGEEVPVEIGLSPIQWEGNTYVLVSVVDIRERYYQKRLLEQAQQRFDRAVGGAMDGLWEWRIKRNEVWMSDQFFKILGYDPRVEEASFDFWESRIHPEDHQEVMRVLNAHLSENETYSTEHRLLCGDGVYRWVLSRGSSYYDGDGEREFLSGSLSIIQDRKDTERDLREKTAFLDTIYNGIQHGIFVVDVRDKDFYFSAFNPAEERLTGIPFEAVRDKRPRDLVPQFFPEVVAETIERNYMTCYDQKEKIEYTEMIPIQGRETWWITHLTPLLDENDTVYRIIGSASEITSLKTLEAQLRDKEEYLRKIVDYSLNGLYIFDLKEQRNLFINPAYTKITGWSLEDLNGMDDLMALFHPSDLQAVVEHLTDVTSLELGQNLKLEYRFRHKNGDWVWCFSNDAVFTVENGEPTQVIGTFIDITPIKLYGAKLEESNRELEQFAFVASHDLREPLRKIKAFADLLASRFSEELPAKAKDYLDRMASASHRLDNMINDLLAFSRISQNQIFSEVDLNVIMENVLTDLQTAIEESKAEMHIQGLPKVEGDPNHFYQLMLNLLSNALKYRREGISPKVEVYFEDEVNIVRLLVQDNGIGFEKEQSNEIFQIFKRLHGRSQYSGNGIGLAVCKKIVERHKGKIWAEPRTDDSGARFIIEVPKRH